MLPIALEIFICVGAVFSRRNESTILLIDIEEPTSLDQFCIWYTAVLTLIFGSFLIMVAVVPICCIRKRVKLSDQLRKLKHEKVIEKLYNSKGVDPSKFWNRFN